MLTLDPGNAAAAVRWDQQADVVVVGSGASGAVAALAAHERGSRVLMLEKSPVFGGTSAKSAGMFWIANNFHMREKGLADPKPQFIAYCARYAYPHLYNPKSPTLGLSRETYDLIAAYYEEGSVMVDAMRRMGALRAGRFHILPENEALDLPDYFEHGEENQAARGRGLGARKADGSLGFGSELMGQLKAKLDAFGIPVLTSHRVVKVVMNKGGEVVGVIAENDEWPGRRARASGRGLRHGWLYI